MNDGIMRRGVSRRDFVKGAGVVALGHSALGTAQEAVRRVTAKTTLAYVGTYLSLIHI